ncbi:uncharacterized protein LOC143204673 [Rhynchophorus ferrugineus]|uniref:uncharacterized protein LOC143204673 n=1 Tax=Rhynchophorus ferrugineus TaxID=354439 RepID=UPI003FCD64C0
MVYKEKSGYNPNIIENNPYYTPHHHYNTRLSARLNSSKDILNSRISNSKISKRLDYDCPPSEEKSYVLEGIDRHSDRFSTCSSQYTTDLAHNRNSELFEEQIKSSLLKVGNMDIIENHCLDNDRRKYLIKNCSIALMAVVIGWYVNHIRTQLVDIKTDLESSVNQINTIQDARLDDVYRLSEMGKKVKELAQNQVNLQYSINKMIEQEINKMYSDKTGRTDFALESAGNFKILVLSRKI